MEKVDRSVSVSDWRWGGSIPSGARVRLAMGVRRLAGAIETAQGFGVAEHVDVLLERAAGALRWMSGKIIGCACTTETPDECAGASRWEAHAPAINRRHGRTAGVQCSCACHGPAVARAEAN